MEDDEENHTAAPMGVSEHEHSELADEVVPGPDEDTAATEQASDDTEPATTSVASDSVDGVTKPESVTANPPSPSEEVSEDIVSDGATATVKIVLLPSGQMVTMAYSLNLPLLEMTDHFASEFMMPAELIVLFSDGKEVNEISTLADLGVTPNATVQLELKSADPDSHPIGQYGLQHEYQMPDVITVQVKSDAGQQKYVVVEIERKMYKKPYLGGYRHKLSGVEFHNAFMQTPWTPNWTLTRDNASCRDTQTVQQRHQRQQTFNDISTQFTGVGVYISNAEDKLLEPGPYTLADDCAKMILQKIIIIQKYYRRWLAIRKVAWLKEARRRRLEWEQKEELRKLLEREEKLQLEFQRKMKPRTKVDFDLLYAALEKWRLGELDQINSTVSGAQRKAALCMLLEQETELLAAIDRHKLEAGTEEMSRCIQNFLNKGAAPKKWRGFDGQPTQMVTTFTLRAKELRDIYNSLNMKYLTQDERLDILLTLKHTVMEHDCMLTRDIVELIDREADLLMRGVSDDNLMGLRKRISTLFLQYIKTPTFNPEAANLLKVPQNPSKLRKNIYYCPSCIKYLPSTEFNLYTNSRTPGNCRRCTGLDNIARPRLDLSHFRRMLKSVRMSEEMYKDGSQFAFIMQEKDIRYLVEYIWNRQSVLSDWKDLHDLVLVRWDKKAHWSPWNCIVLTSEEAESHDKIENLDEVYGEVFQQKLNQKHTVAFKYFSQLPSIARMLSVSTHQPSTTSGAKRLRPGTVSKHTQMPQPSDLAEMKWSKN